MSSLTDTQIASAIDYNARNLYGDKSPYMVGSFWLQHTLAGQDYAATNGLDPQKSYELFKSMKMVGRPVVSGLLFYQSANRQRTLHKRGGSCSGIPELVGLI